MPEISVIIPIYNQEKYLSCCLESFLEQTFTDFELLLIDDGSTDSTPALCDRWKERDCRIRVFHQVNKGVSVARNSGIEWAQGRYIAFCDPDDYVGRDYLSNLYRLLPIGGDGFLVQGYVKSNEDRQCFDSYWFVSCKYSFSEMKLLLSSHELGLMFSCCSKLYERSFLEKYHLRFNSGLSYFEDVLFILDCLLHSDCVYVGDCIDYQYILRSGVFSLSRRLVCFDSAYNAFALCAERMKCLANKYGMECGHIKAFSQSLYYPFSMALKTDYHALESVPARERRSHLKRLITAMPDYVRSYYHPVYKVDRLGRFLLVNNFVWLYDRLFTLLFRLKFKRMFLPVI